MSKFARKKDSSHRAIIEALEAHGIACFDVSSVPNLGFDIVCWRPGVYVGQDSPLPPAQEVWCVMEIKSPKSIHHKSAKTAVRDSQVKARSKAPIPCVSSAAEALSYF